MFNKLNERISIYAVTTTADGSGGQTATETLTRTVWAGVELKTSTRTLDDGRIEAVRRYIFTVRDNGALTYLNTHIITWGTRRFTVIGLNDVKTDYITIDASEQDG